MDETSLRDLLERATEPEPPIGLVAQSALRAGLRLRRRRRIEFAAACATVVAVACALTLAATGNAIHRAAAPVASPTVYVLSGGTVTPISATTDRPGKPIVVGPGTSAGILSSGVTADEQMAMTPDGKTIWVADGDATITPISTATNTAGTPVTVGPAQHPAPTPSSSPVFSDSGARQVLVTPDGKTVYALDSAGVVTPVSTATDRAGRPVNLRLAYGTEATEMAITPDGKTLYVLLYSSWQLASVIPIDTATNTPGAPIQLQSAMGFDILVAPDGQTIYIVGSVNGPSLLGVEVTPISTATNTAGTPFSFATGNIMFSSSSAITPDGRTIYVTTAAGKVIEFSAATGTLEKMITVNPGGQQILDAILITPDGRTAYLLSEQYQTPIQARSSPCPGGFLTPVSTATDTAGTPISVDCPPSAVAASPDGSTVWIGTQDAVQPISTATGKAGKSIDVGGSTPSEILITR